MASHKVFIFLVFNFLSFNCFSQTKIYSLLHEWEIKKTSNNFSSDTNSVLLLNAIAKEYMDNYPDSSIVFSNKSLHLSRAMKFERGKMNALFNLGKVYYIKGSYLIAFENYAKGIEISKRIEDKCGYANGLNGLALIYIGQYNYNAALRELFKAAEVNVNQRDSSQLLRNYFNIGLCYDETSRYDSAILYLDKVIFLGEKLNNLNMIEMAYNRKGETFFHQKDYQQALKYYKMVLEDTNYYSNWENTFAFAGLGQTYYELGKYQLAVNNALIGFEEALKMDAKWDIERALRILSKSYAALNDYEHAYQYQTLFKKYSDTLYSAAKEKEINYLHLQQKEAENQQLIRDNQIQQQKNYLNRLIIAIISIVALFLLVIIILIYKSNRQKNKLNELLIGKNKDIASQKEKISAQNDQLSSLNKTKDQLFSVISHDLKSPFASILGSFELIRLGGMSKLEKDKVFSELHKKVSTVYEMLNNLLYWANSQQKGIRAIPKNISLSEIVEEILTVYSFLAQEKKINIKHHNNLPGLIYADPDHIKIIIQNVVGNAIKFTPQQREINIFYTDDDTHYAVHVKDNGVGISEEKLNKIFKETGKSITSSGTNFEKGTGIGLMLVKQFVDGNDGKLEVNSSPKTGTEFIISFKKVTKMEYI